MSRNETEMEKTISVNEWLALLGIPSNLLGHTYFKYLIETIDKDKLNQYNYTELYREAANAVIDGSPARAERALRHAVESSWLRIPRKLKLRLFGNTLDLNKTPCVSQYIASIIHGYNEYKHNDIEFFYD